MSKNEVNYLSNTYANSKKISCLLFRDYIVSGSQDGILAIWSISDDSGECILQKQLFGRIEVVKIKYELLVTAHFGTDYDVGCITIRQIVSPVELPVIYSVYQVGNFL